MPVTTISVPTDLPMDIAVKRINCLADDLLREYGEYIIELEQTADAKPSKVLLHLNGHRLSGRLSAEPGFITLTVEYHWALLPYKTKVKHEIYLILESLLN